jgi:N-acetyl-D-muramate 6-phosphate phosphatase
MAAPLNLHNAPRGVGAVLFDLDGTFADTAPDMARAINAVRRDHALVPVPLATLRPHVSMGARGMVRAAFGFAPEDAEFPALRDAFFVHYAKALCVETTLFAGIQELVVALQARGIAWGIVTNKSMRFTDPLCRALGLDRIAGCIVSGDTCARAKPHPDSLLHAAACLGVPPAACVYAGDDRRDIEAAHAAGMISVAARYGYLGGSDPATWNAHFMIDHPAELAVLANLAELETPHSSPISISART